MEKIAHLYSLFFNTDLEVKVNVRKTVVKGFGFEGIFFIRMDEGRIKFEEIVEGKVDGILKTWEYGVDRVEDLERNEFLYQEHFKLAERIEAVWEKQSGVVVKYWGNARHKAGEVKSAVELAKYLVSTELESSKVNKLTVQFLLSNHTIYCSNLAYYSLSSKPLNSQQIFPVIAHIHKSIFSTRNKSSVKDKVDKAIQEITRHHECIKNITYKSWIDKVKKGEKLYPNEYLFAKNIVKNAGNKGRTSIKCLKELKIMAMKMRISLSEKKINANLHEGIRKELEKVLSSRQRNLKTGTSQYLQSKKVDFGEISLKSAQNLLKASVLSLSAISKPQLV